MTQTQTPPEAAPAVETPLVAAPADPSPDRTRPAAARFRRLLLAFLLVALLVSSAGLVWLAAHRSGDESGTASQREEVMSLSEQFMLRMGTYGPKLLDDKGQMPEYRSGVKELITPKFATSFDKQVGAAEQLVKQAGATRVADVYATGVSSIDADSADVVMAGSFTNTYAGAGAGKAPGEPLAVRMQVSLVKVGGHWLVDDFAPITTSDTDTGAAQ